ncbi:MAG: gamma-glutamyl-gamma-aminobutyrate hydrolase family protein [Vicinamibacterales bacterium]
MADEFGVKPGRRASRRLHDCCIRLRHEVQHPAAPRARTAATCACYPASAPAAELLATKPDGVFLSNGPGDPARADLRHRERESARGAGTPMFGICLGHQILGLALGAEHLQAEVRASRRQSSGEAPRRPARSRSPRRITASRSTPTRCRPASK